MRSLLKISLSTINRFCTKSPTALPLRSKKSKAQTNKMKYFVDVKRVKAVGGNGGDGCVSLLRLWVNDTAGTDGGDGGNGGHVIINATSNVRDLSYVNSVVKAESGEKGMSKGCHGKNANHLIIEVPVGTVVKSVDREYVGDLDQNGSMFILARGGAGGKGNSFFATAHNQTPLIAEFGAKGEECSYILEVKSMANFGLVGLPNAGKSTFLQAISRAKPKVASYPFTTLKPHVGVVQYDDFEQITIADLPGLIEGSHLNKGLGIEFLRHLERCTCLLYVLDASNDPINDLKILKNELYKYDSSLLNRPYMILANKVDLPEIEENLTDLRNEENVFPVSAKFGTNLKEVLIKMREIFDLHNSNNDMSQ